MQDSVKQYLKVLSSRIILASGLSIILVVYCDTVADIAAITLLSRLLPDKNIKLDSEVFTIKARAAQAYSTKLNYSISWNEVFRSSRESVFRLCYGQSIRWWATRQNFSDSMSGRNRRIRSRH